MRFRATVGAALALATLFGVFGLLLAWFVQTSTQSALEERRELALHVAAMVDDMLGLAAHQMGAMAPYVAWNPEGTVPAAEQPALEQLVHVTGTYEALGVTDARGKVVWELGGAEETRVWSTAPALLRALASGTAALGSAEALTNHPPIAIVAVPLANRGGQIGGAVVGTLHLAHMGAELLPLPSGASGVHAEIVNSQGQVLARSGSGDTAAEASEHLALLGTVLSRGTPGAAIHEPLVGPRHVVAYAPFKRLEGGVFVEEPEDVALAVSHAAERVGLFVGSATLVLVSLVAWWYVSRITRPLRELTAAAHSIAEGSFDQPVRGGSDDEVGVLARGFEEMRVRVKLAFEDRQRWESELEKRVEERTEAVHQLLGRVISAQEEERKRVARELHDGPIQDLAALLIAIDTLEAGPTASDYRDRLIHRVRTQALEALKELRRLLLDLRPSALDDLGLVAALRWYVDSRLAGSGIQHEVTVQGTQRRLPPTLETVLFRIVQEAVNNATRHAAPQRLSVRLDFTEPDLVAVVEDDGSGFDPEAIQRATTEHGMGLAGMRERADLVGGSVEIQSTPGRGTRVVARIPVTEGVRESDPAASR